jgi:hypothetical protein
MTKKLLILVILLLGSIPASEILSPVEVFAQVDTAWVRRYNGPANSYDQAYAMSIDRTGNVYVTGRSLDTLTFWDCATIKYYPNGDTAWIRRYEGGINGFDEAKGIAVDSSGNIYVTGNAETLEWKNYVTIKYYSNGDTAWVRRYNGPANQDDLAMAIAVDISGNVYVTGVSSGGETGGDCATIKYYPNGDTAWVRRYSGDGSSLQAGRALVIDTCGNVYVTGFTYAGTGGPAEYLTIKYYPNGDTAWVRGYYFGDSYAIAVDESCYVYVGGPTGTVKLDSDGEQLWVASGDGSAIAVDGFGNVYVTGASGTIKYNADGNELWIRSPGGVDIALDTSNNVYVTAGSSDYVTVKYYPNGDTAWVRAYNGPGNGSDYGKAVAVDGSGNVYVTGTSYGSETYDDYATIKYVQGGDLYVTDVKPVQVVFDAPALVVGKKTAVKVNVISTFDHPVEANLKVTYNYRENSWIETGRRGNGITLSPGENWGYVPGGPASTDSQAWNFGNEFYWTSAGTETQLSVEVDPFNNIEEFNEGNNIFICGSLSVWDTKDPYKILYQSWKLPPWDICLVDPGVSFSEFDETATMNNYFIGSTYPFKIGNPYYMANPISGFGQLCLPIAGLACDLATLALMGFMSGADRAIGIASPTYFSFHTFAESDGVALPGINAGLIKETSWIAGAHEIHHTYDNWRAGDNEEYKTNPPGNDAYGFWVERHDIIDGLFYSQEKPGLCFMGEKGGQSDTFQYIYPEHRRDYWVCNECYAHLLATFKEDKAETKQYEKVMFVSGSVDLSDSVQLRDMYILENAPITSPAPGEYKIRILDDYGQVIQETPFEVYFWMSVDTIGRVDLDTTFFAFTVPYPDTSKFQIARIQMTHNESVLAERTVSANTPTVNMVFPNGGELLHVDSSYTISWSGDDLDDDTLNYCVLFTDDGGNNWQTLVVEIPDTQFVWNTSNLSPGDEYKIRVIVTDGINTAVDESDSSFQVTLSFIHGDANADGVINSADVVYLMNYLFKGGPAPEPLEAGDVNCDGVINSADVVYLINYLFKGGPAPSC